MSFAPTQEQDSIVAAASTGQSGVIEAGAGTGKTSTLKLISDALSPKRGLYLAYNKAIQLDARGSFPSNVKCMTSHGIAYGAMKRSHPDLMRRADKRDRTPSWTAAEILNIPFQGFSGSERPITRNACAAAAQATVGRFANSADAEINEYHVPREFEGEDQMQFVAFVLPFARKAWADLQSPVGRLTFTPDHFRKIWALGNPILNYGFILYDEAQDAEPVMAALVARQRAQVIMVGDSAQAIYGWRGCQDAMSKFDAEWRLPLTQSFRFGQAIADEANRFLALLEAGLRLKGFDKLDSVVESVEDPDAILCRTNAAVIEHAMAAQAQGRKVAIVGGTKEIASFARAADKLMSGGKTEHADLVAFRSWDEVRKFANEEDGRDLKVMVNLIDNYGVQTVLEVCNNSTTEDQADLIVSTAHKAKGREWDRVRIANDFRTPEEGEIPARAELMLAYVAVTRAKLALDNAGLSWVGSLV